MKKLAFEKLVQRMTAHDTTHGWDVLVSFDEDKVNQLLKANPISPLESFPKFNGTAKVEGDDDEPENRTYEFKLSLIKPVLQFQSAFGKAKLTADITGTFQQISPHNKHPKDFPDGYQLQFDVDLKNVKGTYSESGNHTIFYPDRSDDQFKSVATNYVVKLSPEKSSARGICLTFDDAKGTLIGNPPKDKELTAGVKMALQDGLSPAIKKLPQEHFITGVTQYMADQKMIVLQPTWFCFTVQPADVPNKLPGALLMWIAVKGGHDHGKQQGGATELHFEPDSDSASPIPDQCSASIIFSHNIMANAFFVPSLKSGFDDIRVTSNKGVAGMTLEGSMQSDDIDIEKVHKDKWWDDHHWQCWDSDPIHFSTDKPATKIKVNPGIVTSSSPSVQIDYESEEQVAKWSIGTLDNSVDPPAEGAESGIIDDTFCWGAKGSWNGGTSDHPNLLRLKFEKDKHWTVHSKGKDPGWLQKLIAGGTTDIPNFVSKLDPPVPNLDLEMKALDYFLVTNLLFPGKHVFHAHPPNADKDKKTGLATPRDFILTGNIIEPKK